LTGRERCIQNNPANGLGRLVSVAAHGARHIATALFDLDLHVQLAALRQVGNHVVGIDDLDVVRGLDVGSGHHAFAILAQAQGDFITVVQLEDHALEVQQDADHVFLDAIDGRVLMKNTSDGDFSCCITHHGRQQHTAQGVAQRMAVAALKRLQSHLGAVGAKLFDVNGFGFQQVGLHQDFLSIPPARYTGKAGEAPWPRCPAAKERNKQPLIAEISANTVRRSTIR
jgi:hypothetical protein